MWCEARRPQPPRHSLASAHLERLAPEAQPTSPLPRQPGLELVAEAARAAEPDFRAPAVGGRGGEVLGRQVVAGGAVVDVQAHARQLGAQVAQALDEGVVRRAAGAVVQLHRRGRGGVGAQGVEPGQEGCHADAAGDPNLARLAVLAAEHEAAVGAFDGDGLTDCDAAGELAGVVAQGLDLEGEAAVAVVGAGDGEGVRALETLEADKGELLPIGL